MPSIQVRYPGRACILGEHCDWAGGASLTTPLPMGIVIRAEPGLSKVTVRSEMNNELLEGSWSPVGPKIDRGPLRFVPAAIHVLEQAGITVTPVDLWVNTDLPAGRGFSSSAAFSLGILDAISRSSGIPLQTKQLVDMAFELENRVLGVGCGKLDPAACAAAQPLFLRWSHEKGKSIGMHAHRVSPMSTFHFVVSAFDRPRNTVEILEVLNRHHNGPVNDPDGDAVREAIAEFGSLAEAGAHAMQIGDIEALGQSMNHAQEVYEVNLAGRFSSTQAPRLIHTCKLMRERGALGVKFSGAGGDGSIVALFESENAARASAIEMDQLGMQSWYCPTGPT